MSSIALSTTRTISAYPSQPAQSAYLTSAYTAGRQTETFTVITATSGTPGTVALIPGIVDASLSQGALTYLEVQNLDPLNAVIVDLRDGSASPVSNKITLPAGGNSRIILYSVSTGVTKAAGAMWPPNFQVTGTAVSPVQITVSFG